MGPGLHDCCEDLETPINIHQTCCQTCKAACPELRNLGKMGGSYREVQFLSVTALAKNCGPLWSPALWLFGQACSYGAALLREYSRVCSISGQLACPAAVFLNKHLWKAVGVEIWKLECPDLWHRPRPNCGPTPLNTQLC